MSVDNIWLPAESTILRFGRPFEEQKLSIQITTTINATLAVNAQMFKLDIDIDVSLIVALSSSKKSCGKREPEMHQTQKGNQRHFGLKAHIEVDADSGLVHTVIGTTANVNDLLRDTASCGARKSWPLLTRATKGRRIGLKPLARTGIWHPCG